MSATNEGSAPRTPALKVLVGLGNPEPEYLWSRHNAGFDVLDRLAARLGSHFIEDTELRALVSRHDNALLVKPQTGMNDSGVTVRALVDRLGISPSQVVVVYDDVSMPVGKLRFAARGGAGGHHGIESIARELGGDSSFHRLRVAVGPDPGGAERFNFVTAPIPAELREVYTRVYNAAAQGCQLWLSDTIDACMCRYNGPDWGRESAS